VIDDLIEVEWRAESHGASVAQRLCGVKRPDPATWDNRGNQFWDAGPFSSRSAN